MTAGIGSGPSHIFFCPTILRPAPNEPLKFPVEPPSPNIKNSVLISSPRLRFAMSASAISIARMRRTETSPRSVSYIFCFLDSPIRPPPSHQLERRTQYQLCIGVRRQRRCQMSGGFRGDFLRPRKLRRGITVAEGKLIRGSLRRSQVLSESCRKLQTHRCVKTSILQLIEDAFESYLGRTKVG